MQYGDELEVLEDGPFVAPKLLQMMGISNGATCWGLWTTSNSSRNRNRRKTREQLPHMMVSPIHPDLWPISFQLKIMLRDEPGSMTKFLETISGCKLDAQFSECTFAGYDRVVLNSLYTFSDLINWKTDFLKFYLTSEHNGRLNKAWSSGDKLHAYQDSNESNGPVEGASQKGHFYFEAVVEALGISQDTLKRQCLDLGKTRNQQRPTNPVTTDSIRRHSLEWLGRQMIARLTSLWITVWLAEYKIFHKARHDEENRWENGTGGRNNEGRPPHNEINWKRFNDFDMDPKGDYFFPSKSVQTGRRPWNIELPFPPSWHGSWTKLKSSEKQDKFRIDKSREMWDQSPSMLDEMNNIAWFKDPQENIEKLFELVKNTEDLIYATRPGTEKPRLTRNAILARQSKTANRWINTITERILRNNWLPPYTGRATYELAYAAIWKRDKPPVEFRYDQRIGQLTTSRKGILAEDLATFENDSSDKNLREIEFPRAALASFNTQERFLRLRFIDRPTSDTRIVSFDIDFEVRAPVEQDVNSVKDFEQPTSQGLIHLLCQTASDQGINLLRVSTSQKEKRPADGIRPLVEVGSIKLVGQLPDPHLYADLHKFEKIFRECIQNKSKQVPHCKNIKLIPRIVPWGAKHIFWSSTFNHDRHEELFKLASEATETFGMNLLRVKDRSVQTTQTICEQIRNADAVLQFICLRDSDHEKVKFSPTWQPEYVWLHSEYAIAHALGKPIIRIIDTSMPEHIKRQFDKYNRDAYTDSIDLRASALSIEQKLKDIARELRSKLADV